MTNSSPPEPPPSSTDPLGFDEFIGIFIAFTTIGAILFWSIASKNQKLELNNFLFPLPSPSLQQTPTTPQATVREQAPLEPLPTAAPTESTDDEVAPSPN